MCNFVPKQQQPPPKKEKKKDSRSRKEGEERKRSRSLGGITKRTSSKNAKTFLSAKRVITVHMLEQVDGLSSVGPDIRDMYRTLFCASMEEEGGSGECRERVKKLLFYTLLNDFYDAFSRDPEPFLRKQKQDSPNHRLVSCVQSSLKRMISRVALEIGTLKYGVGCAA